MKYFLIKQDNISNIPQIVNWYKKIDKRSIDNKEYDKVPPMVVLEIMSNNDISFVDFILHPFFLVSERVEQIIKMFEPNLKFKQVFIQDRINHITKQYFFPILDSVDCLDENSLFNLDKSILKKGIIIEKELKDKAIFLLDNVSTQQVVFRMDFLEAVLRRGFTGITFEELEKKN